MGGLRSMRNGNRITKKMQEWDAEGNQREEDWVASDKKFDEEYEKWDAQWKAGNPALSNKKWTRNSIRILG